MNAFSALLPVQLVGGRLRLPLLLTGLLVIAGLPANAQPGTGNLIRNGDFQVQGFPGQPDFWNVNAGPQSISFPQMNGDPYCSLDQDPQGQNYINPYRLLDQFLPDFPFETLPPGVAINVRVAIPPGSPATQGTIRFELHMFGNSVTIFEIPVDLSNVPKDGEFHSVGGYFEFPPNFFSQNNINQVYFAITKFGVGPICVDDLTVLPGPPPREFDVIPGRGSILGGTEIRIQSPDPINDLFVHIGGLGAQVIDRQANELTVICPPSNRTGPADIQLFGQDGQETLIPGGFLFDPPLQIHDLHPRTIGPNPTGNLHIFGTGFLPGAEVHIGGMMIPPDDLIQVDTELIELKLESISPIEVEFPEVQVTNPGGLIAMGPFPLQIVPQPVVTDIQPQSGSFAGGTFIQIHGQNLMSDQLIVNVNGQPLIDMQQPSDTVITGYTPPGFPGTADLHLNFFDGVQVDLPNFFEYAGNVPGDFNSDGMVTAIDLQQMRDVFFGQPGASDNPEADVDGNGVIDLKDLRQVFFDTATPNILRHPAMTEPELILPSNPPPAGFPFEARVRNTAFNAPVVIDMGDGFHTNVAQDSVFSYTYDDPGTYTVTMETEHSTTEPQVITIPDPNPVHVLDIDLSLNGNDIDGNPIEGRSAQLDPIIPPPELTATITSMGSGLIHGMVMLDSSLDNADLAIPFSAEIPDEPAGEKSVEVNLGPVPKNPGESHIISVEVTHGANVEPEVIGAMPVAIQVPDFVTAEDCAELERLWKALVAAKTAKKADCEALQKQLDKLREDLAKKEAEKPTKEQDLQDCKDEKDSKQGDLDSRIAAMNAFLGPNANVQTYMGQGDFPPGDNIVGAKRNGSASGVGMSFGDAQQALDGIANYEGATNRNFGKDMAEMRQLIKDIEDLDGQIQNKEQDVNKLNGEIDDLKNNKIPDKEQELADCKAACDTLEGQIKALVDANEECLKQLEEQRKAAAGIRDAERQGSRTQNQADRADGNAENAEKLVAGRGGSPGQIADDEEDIATAKACQETAQSLIDDGNGLLRLAKAALAQGNTESANTLSEQAKAKFDAAKAKLDEGKEHIDTATANARSRKRRDCPAECEGLERITEETYKVFTHVVDVSVVLMGYTPEKWASFNEAVKEAIAGLDLVSNIAEAGGDYSPIGGSFTPDVGRTATAIVGAYTEYASRLGLDVWVKHRGHCEVKRTIHRCVNGCWEYIRTETERVGEDFEESIKIGEVPAGTTKAAREGVIRQVLNNYNRNKRIVRKGPPTTSKAQ